jgi:alpha-galactosidase/6-phospho-beta-glucosidase family protein
MKKEYDFSKGVRGKFYDENGQFNIPVYLEPEVESFIAKLAKEQKTNMSHVVNALLFKDKELIEMAMAR